MSNFTNLYDGIKTRIETVLPASSGYMRLYNPYELNRNPENVLRKAWGIAIGGATNTNRQLSCSISIRRDLVVTLTRKALAVDNDAVSKTTTEKDLIEDQLLLIKDFCDNSDLPNTIGIINYESDTGVIRIFDEKENFLALQTTFSIEYFEYV